MPLESERADMPLGPANICSGVILWAEVEPCKGPVMWGLECGQVHSTVPLKTNAATVDLLYVRTLKGMSGEDAVETWSDQGLMRERPQGMPPIFHLLINDVLSLFLTRRHILLNRNGIHGFVPLGSSKCHVTWWIGQCSPYSIGLENSSG